MSAYAREPGKTSQAAPIPQQQPGAAPQAETPIPVDGFRQVLEMLQAADPAFRESLLKRLGARDPRLVRDLRAELEI